MFNTHKYQILPLQKKISMHINIEISPYRNSSLVFFLIVFEGSYFLFSILNPVELV